LLTLKPEMVLVSIGEDRLQQPLPSDLLALAPTALPAPAKLEMELHDLSEEDRQLFMQDLGLTAFRREAILRAVFDAMGLHVFFTTGYDECRSWGVPKGADAVVGASQIHTDLGRGFIRAEVLAYADFQKIYADFKGRVGEHMKEARTLGLLREE